MFSSYSLRTHVVSAEYQPSLAMTYLLQHASPSFSISLYGHIINNTTYAPHTAGFRATLSRLASFIASLWGQKVASSFYYVQRRKASSWPSAVPGGYPPQCWSCSLSECHRLEDSPVKVRCRRVSKHMSYSKTGLALCGQFRKKSHSVTSMGHATAFELS